MNDHALAHLCRLALMAPLALLWIACGGCGHVSKTATPAPAEGGSLRGSQAEAKLTPTALQQEVMRFADQYVSAVAQDADDFAGRVPTAEGRSAALFWKLGQANWAFADAAGGNPVVSALDLVVLATVSRMVQEDDWLPRHGEAARPLLETHVRLEEEAWSIAAAMLRPEQVDELRGLIGEWRTKYPGRRYVGQARFRDFARSLGRLPEEKEKTRPGSVFSLLFLDPLAGIDPAARAIEETRLLAERGMYYFQRMPTLVAWQTELLATKLSRQLFDGITQQREALLSAIASGDALRGTLAELHQTLDAGERMAVSVDAAVKSLDAFVGHFDKAEPEPHPPPAEAAEAKPFDVNDYGKSAAEVAVAARELNSLLSSLDQRLPQVDELADRTSAKVERWVGRLFWLGAALIALFLVSSFLMALAFRFLASRQAGRQRHLSDASLRD